MDTMKVKITQGNHWYGLCVGHQFIVYSKLERTCDGMGYASIDGHGHILARDCEPILEAMDNLVSSIRAIISNPFNIDANKIKYDLEQVLTNAGFVGAY